MPHTRYFANCFLPFLKQKMAMAKGISIKKLARKNSKPFRLLPDVFLGPVCPYVLAPVARFSGVWETPIMTTGGQVNTFRNRDQYPLLVTVGGTYNQFAKFFKEVLKKFKW